MGDFPKYFFGLSPRRVVGYNILAVPLIASSSVAKRRNVEMERVQTGLKLLKSSVDELDAAAERMGGKSRAFVVDVLAIMYARQLGGDTMVPLSMMPTGTRAKKTSKASKPKATPKKKQPKKGAE
jgi:hypothetical protein